MDHHLAVGQVVEQMPGNDDVEGPLGGDRVGDDVMPLDRQVVYGLDKTDVDIGGENVPTPAHGRCQTSGEAAATRRDVPNPQAADVVVVGTQDVLEAAVVVQRSERLVMVDGRFAGVVEG